VIAQLLRHIVVTVYRWFAGLTLCAFAFVPSWIETHAILDAVIDPHTIDVTWFIAVGVCSALLYFLLLLAYRAFTGRGRKQDSGLLPPLALQIFAVLFGAIGALVSGFAVYAARWPAVIGGLLEFLTAAAVFRVALFRKRSYSQQQLRQ
jgi:hypothetical protein